MRIVLDIEVPDMPFLNPDLTLLIKVAAVGWTALQLSAVLVNDVPLTAVKA